ncbi:hypothetical protein ANN_12890 [Periplaneta americana]|uniref:Uncharacterized protein n=1 Tax=Periplaneta americana TaxID=6978 RepID=A0ABQ8TJ76_PERAM|nr:hypothetical protein ANN_12890 [Periplaneta americana]
MWPPRSPDLNSADFWSWCYLKERVFLTHPTTILQLKDAISQEIANILRHYLQNVVHGVADRMLYAEQENGGVNILDYRVWSVNDSEILIRHDLNDFKVTVWWQQHRRNTLFQHIPNLIGPVDNNDVTLQRNRNRTAGRIDGYHGDCIPRTKAEHRHDTTVHDVIRLLIPALYKNQSDSLMAADGDCHHLCKLMAPVRHRWSISVAIGESQNTVMTSDSSALRFGICSLPTIITLFVPPCYDRCSQKPRNIDDLRVKITQAFQQINLLMLQRTWAELHHRYELCRVRNGGHVEL